MDHGFIAGFTVVRFMYPSRFTIYFMTWVCGLKVLCSGVVIFIDNINSNQPPLMSSKLSPWPQSYTKKVAILYMDKMLCPIFTDRDKNGFLINITIIFGIIWQCSVVILGVHIFSNSGYRVLYAIYNCTQEMWRVPDFTTTQASNRTASIFFRNADKKTYLHFCRFQSYWI